MMRSRMPSRASQRASTRPVGPAPTMRTSVFMRATLSEELFCIGEERRRPAGVPEDDRLVSAELAAPDQVDEPGHGAPGVHGIEEDALVAGNELDRFALRLAQHRVAAAEVRV